MRQVIFFDLDGTLIDTSERHYMVYGDILECYGIPNTLSKRIIGIIKERAAKQWNFSLRTFLKMLSKRSQTNG